jgi:hypothetical protein
MCTSDGGGDACLGTATQCTPVAITLDGEQMCQVATGNNPADECDIDGTIVTTIDYTGGLAVSGIISSPGDGTLTYTAQIEPAPQDLLFLINGLQLETADDVDGTLDATLDINVGGCVPGDPGRLNCPIAGTGVQCSFTGSTATLMGWTLTCDEASSSLTGTVVFDAATCLAGACEAVDLVDVSWEIMLLLSLDDKGCSFDCDSTGTGDACVGFGAVCVDVDLDLDASIGGACLDVDDNVIVDNISGFLWAGATNSLKIVPTGLTTLSVEFEGGFKDDDNDGAANEEVEFSVDGGPTFFEPIDAAQSSFTGTYDLTAAPTCSIDYTSFDALVAGLNEFSSNAVPAGTEWEFVAPEPPTPLPTATCTLSGVLGQPGSLLEVRTVAEGALQLIDPNNGDVICSVPGTTVIDSASRPAKSLAKDLTGGPLEVGICLREPTLYSFRITYSGPEAVVTDVVPAELDELQCTASAGTVDILQNGGPKSSRQITWTVPAGEDLTLDCMLQTAGSPGGCKGGQGHRPTSCGPLALNEGATATGTELDPKTGVEEPFTLTTGPLVVTAVEGVKPCE